MYKSILKFYIYKLTKELGIDYSQDYYLGEPKKLS